MVLIKARFRSLVPHAPTFTLVALAILRDARRPRLRDCCIWDRSSCGPPPVPQLNQRFGRVEFSWKTTFGLFVLSEFNLAKTCTIQNSNKNGLW